MNCKKYYNAHALSDVVHKRLTEKANPPKHQKAKLEAFWGKGNVSTKELLKIYGVRK